MPGHYEIWECTAKVLAKCKLKYYRISRVQGGRVQRRLQALFACSRIISTIQRGIFTSHGMHT